MEAVLDNRPLNKSAANAVQKEVRCEFVELWPRSALPRHRAFPLYHLPKILAYPTGA